MPREKKFRYRIDVKMTRFDEALLEYLAKTRDDTKNNVLRHGLWLAAKADDGFEPAEFAAYVKKEFSKKLEAEERKAVTQEAQLLGESIKKEGLADPEKRKLRKLSSKKLFGD